MPVSPHVTYHNNLRTGDQVWNVETKRRGLVGQQPRESSRMTAVIYDGTTTARYTDVAVLRLMVDGKIAEDVPPIDGDLPPLPENHRPPRSSATVVSSGPIRPLEERLAANKAELAKLEKAHAEIRAENERIDQAIKVLKA